MPLSIRSYFVREHHHPLADVTWEKRDVVIKGADGQIVFEAYDLEFPSFWSQRACDIVANKYFRVVDGKRETSARAMVHRVASTIAGWGLQDAYFDAEMHGIFEAELAHILVHQFAAFNSPCFVPGAVVWLEGGHAKKIEDIQIGDTVVSHTGKRQKVTEIHARGVEEPVYRLFVRGLPTAKTECTGGHPFFVVQREKLVCPKRADRICSTFYGKPACAYCGRMRVSNAVEPEWLAAKDIKVGDFVVEASDTQSVSDIEAITMEDFVESDECYVADGEVFSQSWRTVGRGTTKPVINSIPVDADFLRLAGYYLSNGSCELEKRRVRFSFDAEKKRLEIEDTRQILQKLFGCAVQDEFSSGCHTVLVTNTVVAKFIAALFGVGAHHKSVPLWIMALPPEKQFHLLVGIFRGDGHLSRNRLILGLVNERLVRQVFTMLRRCAFLPTLDSGRRSTSVTPQGKFYDRIMWTVSVSPQNAAALAQASFPASTRLQKRTAGKQSAISVDSYVLRPVTRITARDYVGEVYNLEVENDHSYAVEGLAAHNCWFNVGVKEHPRSAACFLLAVEDNMESILDWYKEEGLVFKEGSGAGVNLSKIRAKGSPLSNGGTASGVMSFMKVADANAGAVKSGGSSRRAAKMVILNVDHPEIQDFIACKVIEEHKAAVLRAAGYSDGIEGDALTSVAFQNANNSVAVTDEFMEDVEQGGWHKDSEDREYAAACLFRKIAEAAHACGDPGLFFIDEANRCHTVPNSGAVSTTNPCCLTGDSLVDTSEGLISFVDLLKMVKAGLPLPYAFSYDTVTNLPVLRAITNVWIAGEVSKLIEVETSKGVKIRCTPEHRFLLRNGAYVQARNLRVGDRLRKIGRCRNKARSNRAYLNHRLTEDVLGGTQFQARFMWEQVRGEVPTGYEVHHINEDCTDDRLSNLELVASTTHRKIHSTGENNPRFLPVAWSTLVEVWESIETSSQQEVSPSKWNAYIYNNGLLGCVPLARGSASSGRIQGKTWKEFGKDIEHHRADVNDRVASTAEILCDQPEMVYDMEVKGTHNFGVNSGELHSIVVHNSEFIHLDNSACNLSSMNLLKFLKKDGSFDVPTFKHVVDIMITAQEILVDRSSYPTEEIERVSKRFRPLGLGYNNLGSYLMASGLPYDSAEGRDTAAAITALMTGEAYCQSARIARVQGCFAGYPANADAMYYAIKRHYTPIEEMRRLFEKSPLVAVAEKTMREALGIEMATGYRNAQISLLQPGGTVSFLMDCDTTGIEPLLGLVTKKKLVGGGELLMENEAAKGVLRRLGYASLAEVRPEHLPIFQCALGDNALPWQAHIKMVAAVQPFLSGGVSKTCNLPHDATVEDVEAAYILAWKLGLKSIAIYRDGCKGVQPVTVVTSVEEDEPELVDNPHWPWQHPALPAEAPPIMARSVLQRTHLPDERQSVTHKFSVGGTEGYLIVGLFPSGRPGELFVTMAKEGSTLSGLMDAFASVVSMALQYGMPLEVLVAKLRHTRYEPHGFTTNPQIRMASSLTDYIAQWLERKFISDNPVKDLLYAAPLTVGYGPFCTECAGSTVRNGSCWVCTNCGQTTGCS